MRRDDRAARPQRAGSQVGQARRVPSTGPPRPSSRAGGDAGSHASPNSDVPGLLGGRPSPALAQEPSSARRPGAGPAQAHGRPSSQTAHAAQGEHGAHGAPRPTAAFAAPTRPTRPSSAARGEKGHAAGRGERAPTDVTRTPVFCYLKVYGLNQYARAFIELGLSDMDSIGRLSETEALEFLDRLRIYPGHRLRLLRAIDCLRHAVLGSERRDPTKMLEDDAALDRLCARNESLTKEKSEAETEMKKIQEENTRLIGVIREQDEQLLKAKARVSELEADLRAQTEQVSFLTHQLQTIAEEGPGKENKLYKSYKDSFDDWGEAQKIYLPDTLELDELSSACSVTTGAKDVGEVTRVALADLTPKVAPASAPGGAARMGPGSLAVTEATLFGRGTAVQPRRADLAKSLDSAQVRECLAGFDVDHIIRCLATALQNRLILVVSKPRPHSATADVLASCAVFLEPACREKLLKAAATPSQVSLRTPTTDEGSLSYVCSPFMSSAGEGAARDAPGKFSDPLNNMAVRTVANKWDIYGFLRDVMINFRLEPEVSVVTLCYLERFTELSGVALTPDNWQRLVITAMMLASKVWNDESFENVEFSQLCPLYTLEEINTFERIFLKRVGYRMSVKGSEYAKTYFLLRTLGAKDHPEFIEPISDKRATRLAERCLEKQMEFKERYPVDDPEWVNVMNWTM